MVDAAYASFGIIVKIVSTPSAIINTMTNERIFAENFIACLLFLFIFLFLRNQNNEKSAKSVKNSRKHQKGHRPLLQERHTRYRSKSHNRRIYSEKTNFSHLHYILYSLQKSTFFDKNSNLTKKRYITPFYATISTTINKDLTIFKFIFRAKTKFSRKNEKEDAEMRVSLTENTHLYNLPLFLNEMCKAHKMKRFAFYF